VPERSYGPDILRRTALFDVFCVKIGSGDVGRGALEEPGKKEAE